MEKMYRSTTAMTKNFQRGATAALTDEEALSTVIQSHPAPSTSPQQEENALNHYCGDLSNCNYPAHQGYQWKNRDIPGDQVISGRYLAEGSKVVQTLAHSPCRHKQANLSTP
jgi:hypothetical protein